MAVYRRGKVWWYKFSYRGEMIRESTRQRNKRVAEQIEAAHKTGLAKGEVGIRDRKPVPTLAEFAKRDFLPFVESTFKAKVKTRRYYTNGVDRLLDYDARQAKNSTTSTATRSRATSQNASAGAYRSAASTASCRYYAACFISLKSGARSRKCSRK